MKSVFKSIEHFNISPYTEPNDEDKTDFEHWGVDRPHELYDVMTKFEKSPSELTATEKTLRKKYLNIAKTQITQKEPQLKQLISTLDPIAANNFDSGKKLIIRIIDLLISEIEPISCLNSPECPKCNTKPYIITIIVLIILFLLFLIISRYI